MYKCRECGVDKPAAEMGRNKRYKDGVSTLCKDCNNARAKAWREANPDRFQAIIAKYVESPTGQATLKSYTQAKYQKLKAEGAPSYKCPCGAENPKLFYKTLRYKCKVCARVESNAYNKANRDTPEGRDIYNTQQRIWYQQRKAKS
jgi:hypothetical protein